ncbi:MAG: hypothetical protein ACREHE_08160 [Rhizomicrobium sp.]
MKFMHLAIVVAGSAAGFYWPAQADPMAMDNPVTMNGVETVCTGIGSAQDNPAWKDYPIRVEFSNGGAQYLAGAHIDLSRGGKTLASFDCPGSWVLFRLPDNASYKVAATLTRQDGAKGDTRSATFTPPATGQKRVVIQFPVTPNM